MGIINSAQFDMIEQYISILKSPWRILKKNPGFLEHPKADDKTKERAKLCLEKDF